jgi:ATP-binding cassette, subfamily C (CFTR/MRP), member 1
VNVDSNPDFTFCFKNTVLIWIPCAYLWIFSFFDWVGLMKSKYSDIPWSFLNVSRFSIVVLLLCLSLVDLAMMISLNSSADIFGVQYVSLGIKFITFVSKFTK